MYILTIVNLLCPLCYEIPCITYLPVLSLAMIETVLPPSLIMFVFRVINHFSVAISQAVMVLAYVIITIRPLVRSATMHTILLNQTFVSVQTRDFAGQIYCIRGKSLLELWVTSFLPDWQTPLIFVRFISNFFCICTNSVASAQVILK